jgi:hypothetical protein
MTIRTVRASFTGTTPLLMHNPQSVNPFNEYAKMRKPITDKKTNKTEEDLIELGNIDVRAAMYWDDDLGIYTPASWIYAAIPKTSFAVAKIGAAKIRGGMFIPLGQDKCKLIYDGMEQVKTPTDIVNNEKFRHIMILPQQASRIIRNLPIFHNWAFMSEFEYDDKVIDFPTLKRVVNHLATYGGFGDFRPTFGRCVADIDHV